MTIRLALTKEYPTEAPVSNTSHRPNMNNF